MNSATNGDGVWKNVDFIELLRDSEFQRSWSYKLLHVLGFNDSNEFILREPTPKYAHDHWQSLSSPSTIFKLEECIPGVEEIKMWNLE